VSASVGLSASDIWDAGRGVQAGERGSGVTERDERESDGGGGGHGGDDHGGELRRGAGVERGDVQRGDGVAEQLERDEQPSNPCTGGRRVASVG
jgi:hypothetical protein